VVEEGSDQPIIVMRVLPDMLGSERLERFQIGLDASLQVFVAKGSTARGGGVAPGL